LPLRREPTIFKNVYSSELTRHIDAPPDRVYAALLDAAAIAKWRVPDGMSSEVHQFQPYEGGSFRISLTYESTTSAGKTSDHTDTYHGRFVKLVPNEQVVEVTEFETADEALRGEMTMTTTLTAAADGGTDIVLRHDGIPDRVPRADNEAGTLMSLNNLARLVEDSGRGA
jgi:uncharacterized protein YndB with AHSA1/START domain